jgi:hypothetical protein
MRDARARARGNEGRWRIEISKFNTQNSRKIQNPNFNRRRGNELLKFLKFEFWSLEFGIYPGLRNLWGRICLQKATVRLQVKLFFESDGWNVHQNTAKRQGTP